MFKILAAFILWLFASNKWREWLALISNDGGYTESKAGFVENKKEYVSGLDIEPKKSSPTVE